MGVVFRRRRSVDIATGGRENTGDSSRARRLILVAGSLDEWADFSEAEWSSRLETVGAAGAAAGIESLRIVPVAGDRRGSSSVVRREVRVEGCRVVADPRPDGRVNLVDAINEMSEPISEESIQKMVGASGGDVDLVIVLGGSPVLPKALVWELAYAELVYVDANWTTLSGEHVRRSLDEFAVRQRRFGGVTE
ncbi:MAG: hypothetical protein RL413_1552 [Actinomycetota bacterium]|jgi:hypothetical protein